jgi:hypothetical protein
MRYTRKIGLGDYESTVTCIMLWVAFGIYATFTLKENNPLFGAVFIWVLIVIKE